MSTLSYPHTVTRLAFDTGQPNEEFRARYEQAVPLLDLQCLAGMVASAGWDAIVADTAASAPFGFLRYWRSDMTPLMRLAGDTWLCTAYLMGNHTIAEQMFRHDPAAMLYAPLRTAIYMDAAGSTRLAVDQPSTLHPARNPPAVKDGQVVAEADGSRGHYDRQVWKSEPTLAGTGVHLSPT